MKEKGLGQKLTTGEANGVGKERGEDDGSARNGARAGAGFRRYNGPPPWEQLALGTTAERPRPLLLARPPARPPSLTLALARNPPRASVTVAPLARPRAHPPPLELWPDLGRALSATPRHFALARPPLRPCAWGLVPFLPDLASRLRLPPVSLSPPFLLPLMRFANGSADGQPSLMRGVCESVLAGCGPLGVLFWPATVFWCV